MSSSFNIKQIISPNNKLELGKGSVKNSITFSNNGLIADKLVYALNGTLTGIKFIQTQSKSITGNSEASLIGSGIGSLTIQANTLRVGQTFKFKIQGFLTTGSTAPDSTLKIKFGTQNLINNTSTLPNNLTNGHVDLEYIFTVQSIVGTTASIIGQGRTFINNGTGIGSANMRGLIMPTPININTSIDNTVDVTYQFSSTGQTITMTNSILEVLY